MDDIDAIDAVLVPPRLRRFRALTGVGADERLEVELRGWHKLVVLAGERVVLVPRHTANVDGLQRELTAYRVLERGGAALVPKVVGEWHDDEAYPHAFAAVTRLAGAHRDDPTPLFDQLGRAIAAWHDLPVPDELASAPPPAGHELPHQRWLHRALDPATTADAVEEAVDALGLADRRQELAEHLAAAAELRPVLVHGDIHEDQLLADGDRLTGVLDWETARIDHPFFDFDFGEWGTALWRDHRPEFPELWRRQWEPYARARGLDHPGEPHGTSFQGRQQRREATTSRSAP
jgi:aminoglycoside phosphotransferase (APT) family kinase protein